MQKKKIWFASTASVGIHVGLLALLSQAQAMPKPAPSAQPVTISVTLNTTSVALNSVAKPQQAQLQQQQIVPTPTPTPTPDKPAIVKTSAQTKKPAAKPAKPKATPKRPAMAKPRDTAPSQTSKSIAETTSATAATPSKAPVASDRPVASAHEHYPARYRGPQPAPNYPRMARRRGLEGTCVIEVLMDTQGEVITLALKQSTGHTILDQAAPAAVKDWKFIAPTGIAGASKALVPVRFALT